ncbi:hypothetical protein FN846DRAFT_168231 [Sphaerosporella brunnea]|uniref:Uncharacterized protein n=1 Tax=Sphaerosporella brunnea TaxID=1250544 RepID=A0A5J5EPY7_9PEZI|nr:hypothetical protein FN846DRAFT_168231 [Sphaerosporella brunnea]
MNVLLLLVLLSLWADARSLLASFFFFFFFLSFSQSDTGGNSPLPLYPTTRCIFFFYRFLLYVVHLNMSLLMHSFFFVLLQACRGWMSLFLLLSLLFFYLYLFTLAG